MGMPGTTGKPGEDAFLSHLSSTLPDEYFTLRNILVKPGLDIDILMIGPTGLWIFDSKYWSGSIILRQGQWWHSRKFFDRGGYLQQEDKPIKRPPDEQWLDEVECVKRVLGRARGLTRGKWENVLKGGLVFTHFKSEPLIDDTCKAAWGKIHPWMNHLLSQEANPIPNFSVDLSLQIADILLKHSLSLSNGSCAGIEQISAMKVADRIAAERDARIQEYLRRHESERLFEPQIPDSPPGRDRNSTALNSLGI